MKLHQLLDITKTKIGLLCESVMTVLSEELSAELDLSNVLRSVKVLADVHDGIEVRALSEDFNRFLVLACLNVKFGGLLPVVTVALELSLLDQNHGVEERSLTRPVLSVFSDQVIRFLKLLQRRIQRDCLVKHIVFDVVGRGFLEFSLQRKDLRLEPNFV